MIKTRTISAELDENILNNVTEEIITEDSKGKYYTKVGLAYPYFEHYLEYFISLDYPAQTNDNHEIYLSW